MINIDSFYGKLPYATMYSSPLKKRLEMIKNRCRSYPLDNNDFILNDLEHPESIRRHADFCTGDLSGRYLEMLTVSMPHDCQDEDRMHELFNRILKCQSRQGPFGQEYMQGHEISDEAGSFGLGNKLFVGLIKYYLLTGNGKAFGAVKKLTDSIISRTNYIVERLKDKSTKGGIGSAWITEPLALYYAITGDERCLDICKLVARALPENIENLHSHGLMTTLRGLQLASIYSGDLEFIDVVERFRKQIAEQAVWVDGNISEVFPLSGRNEGCSIADWIMLNLNSGFILNSDEAYEKAERAMFNAFSLNQIVSGGTGTRQNKMDRRGYQQGELSEECWWCCTHSCGLALAEFANHAVSFRNGELLVKLLIPGHYTFNINNSSIVVDITTQYPEKATTFIFVQGEIESNNIKIRVPESIRNAQVCCHKLPNGSRRYSLTGDMGYYIEETEQGVVLKYGPLIMVPLRYMSTSQDDYIDYSKTTTPVGYVPPIMPREYPAIIPSQKKDTAGFLVYDKEPWPIWQCYEEGVLSPLAYGELSVNVPLYYSDGCIRYTRFFPELNSTTTLIGFDLPIIFNKG